MWACLDWDLTGYKIIMIFWRVMIRYKRFWILGLRNVSKSIDQVQEILNFLQRSVSLKSIDQFARSWQFLKKCDQDWTGDMQQVHGVLKKFEQDFSVLIRCCKIDAASKIINSEQHWEQDWSSYPCGWRFFFWGWAFAKFWSHLLNSAASFSTCLLAVLYMLVTQAHPCTCLWKAIHFGHGREEVSTERIFCHAPHFFGGSIATYK